MRWEYRVNTPGVCDMADVSWLPNFLSCIRTWYGDKEAEVWTFYENKDFTYKDQIDILPEHYPQDPDNFDEPGYQHLCNGDSGGGHWMKGGDGGTKQVLIGINSIARKQCGLGSYMEKINNKDTLAWIKKHYCPKDEPTCKCCR